MSYLIYIKEQRSHNNSLINMDELKAVARVLTNQGVKNPATENVHFSPPYGAGVDLLKYLPGESGEMVCGCCSLLLIDCFYIMLFSTLKQTHCTYMLSLIHI